MLLNESHLSNQHIEIVRMFLDSEFLITELQVLAYYTHVVTLPFLYFVEVNSQEELLEMFPRLFNDLKCSAVDTLKEYQVNYPNVQVTQPSTEVAWHLFKKCVLMPLQFSNDKPVESMGLGKGLMPHQEQHSCIFSRQMISMVCHKLSLMLNATSLFLVREPLLLNL